MNIKILEKFDIVSIVWCQYDYILLLTLILYTCTSIKNIDHIKKIHSNYEKNRLELEYTLSKKLAKSHKVTWNRYCILIVKATFYKLY